MILSKNAIHIFCNIVILFVSMQLNEVNCRQNTDIKKMILLGEDTVFLRIYTKLGKNMVYAHVHENETASLEAGLKMIEKYGGKLVTLEHSSDSIKNRNIRFTYRKTTYQFDPNRIYTADDMVLKKSISVVAGSGKVDYIILKMVKRLAKQIWNEIKEYPLIVALHNNKNTPAECTNMWFFWNRMEPESYNITSYVKKNDQSSDSNKSCAEIYINPAVNNSEFFIVTQKADFDMFVRKKYSVVLQNANPVDDGSMSVFATGFGKRYINSEAKHGRVIEQEAMLELLILE